MPMAGADTGTDPLKGPGVYLRPVTLAAAKSTSICPSLLLGFCMYYCNTDARPLPDHSHGASACVPARAYTSVVRPCVSVCCLPVCEIADIRHVMT